MNVVSDGIVCHVDSRVGEGLDDPLLVPREQSSESKLTTASPFLEPAKYEIKLLHVFLVIRVEVRTVNVIVYYLLPVLFAVGEVPLVSQGDYTFVTYTMIVIKGNGAGSIAYPIDSRRLIQAHST